METLALGGLFLALGVIIGLILSIIGLFFGNIIMFDSIALSIFAGLFVKNSWGFHSAIALVIGIVAFFLLMRLHTSEYGFWIIGGSMSLAWGLVLTAIFVGSKADKIWQLVMLVIISLVVMGLHLHAREKM